MPLLQIACSAPGLRGAAAACDWINSNYFGGSPFDGKPAEKKSDRTQAENRKRLSPDIPKPIDRIHNGRQRLNDQAAPGSSIPFFRATVLDA